MGVGFAEDAIIQNLYYSNRTNSTPLFFGKWCNRKPLECVIRTTGSTKSEFVDYGYYAGQYFKIGERFREDILKSYNDEGSFYLHHNVVGDLKTARFDDRYHDLVKRYFYYFAFAYGKECLKGNPKARRFVKYKRLTDEYGDTKETIDERVVDPAFADKIMSLYDGGVEPLYNINIFGPTLKDRITSFVSNYGCSSLEVINLRKNLLAQSEEWTR